MKTSCPKAIEVLVIIAIVTVLAALLLPAIFGAKSKYAHLDCFNNLRQVGLACRVWSEDNKGVFPMGISETNGGTQEFITGPNAFRHFQVMSNELSTPKVLFCPFESEGRRFVATNFAINNSNVSFFVGIDDRVSSPRMILFGDHNLTNGTPVNNGQLELSANRPTGWTKEVHAKYGNVCLVDGSVQRATTPLLRQLIEHSGTITNRLQMPILAP